MIKTRKRKISKQKCSRRWYLGGMNKVVDETCAICFEIANGPGTCETSCQHNYHYSCLCPWLESHKTCPKCRKKLSSDEIYDIMYYERKNKMKNRIYSSSQNIHGKNMSSAQSFFLNSATSMTPSNNPKYR